MADNVLAVALTPLVVALLLPSVATVRVTINWPSSTKTSSKRCSEDCGIEKRPLATNLSDPLRTKALSAFPPRIRFKAVKIIVFPAPVSPVRTVKPFDISNVD